MKAWHFTKDTLRNGEPIPSVGEPLRWDGPCVMCESGLHASKRIIDALTYAPGSKIHRVDCREIQRKQHDKLLCRERTILWTVDGEGVLSRFARLCALDVIHLWSAPEVVLRFLHTGDESLRSAAWDAAWAAARAAAWDAARDAARAAAWDAARDAAWAAARDAARDAAWAAARDAARDTAWDAARDAARAAAWDAARDMQNKRLTRMVLKERAML